MGSLSIDNLCYMQFLGQGVVVPHNYSIYKWGPPIIKVAPLFNWLFCCYFPHLRHRSIWAPILWWYDSICLKILRFYASSFEIHRDCICDLYWRYDCICRTILRYQDTLFKAPFCIAQCWGPHVIHIELHWPHLTIRALKYYILWASPYNQGHYGTNVAPHFTKRQKRFAWVFSHECRNMTPDPHIPYTCKTVSHSNTNTAPILRKGPFIL